MALLLPKRTKRRSSESAHDLTAIVVEEHELDDARRDPRVQEFLVDADEYLQKLESERRNG